MNRADRDAADAKLERVDELLEEISDLNSRVDQKMDTVNRLLAEAEELSESEGSQ